MNERAVSNQKFADALEVCLPTVSKWIEGNAMPQPEKLLRIADFFSVEPNYFLEKPKEVVSQALTAKRIFKLRQQNCMSRAMLARAIDVSLQTIVLWENGSKPSVRGIGKLCEYFGISPEYFTNEKYELSEAAGTPKLPLSLKQRGGGDKILEYLAPWKEASNKNADIQGYILTILKKYLPHSDLSIFTEKK